MLAELVLATRLLGLVSDQQPVEVQVEPNVRAVELVVDGKTISRLTTPYKAVLNFGPELAPHEVTAIAFDASGGEVGRDRQFVNLPRPQAEAEIELDTNPSNGRVRATIRWQHIASEEPKRIALKLDGKPIGNTATTTLPALEKESIHVLKAELEFANKIIATKELVFGGHYSTQVPAELTGILATDGAQCFRSGEQTARAAAVENPDAVVLFVRGSDGNLARKRLSMPVATSREAGMQMHQRFRIDHGKMRITWPAARELRDSRQSVVNLFYRSETVDGFWGTQRMLTLYRGPNTTSQRFADAVAVAAVQALDGVKRRAVVLVLSGERDDSRHSPAVVRRYLERIGVPLHVWSLVGATPEMTAAWGEVKDVSNPDHLRIATEELRADLERQRIAWLPLQPIEALRAKPVSCAP
jgi:hypothetical protein